MKNAASRGQPNAHVKRSSWAWMLALTLSCGSMLPASAAADKPKVATSSGQAARAAAKAPAPASTVGLSADEMAIAQQVERGSVACELGVSVSVTEDAKAPGYFSVQTGKHRFRMAPVVSNTGAIRLEDKQAGAVWLQLPHKSMLMSQKLGSRLADACVSATQAQVALALEKNPPPALLDAPSSVLAARGFTP